MPDTTFSSIAASLQRALPAAPRRWLLKRGPLLVFLALLVLFAWLAARLTWQFLSPPTALVAARPAATPTARGNRRVSAEQIAAAHLFGIAAESAAAGGANAKNAPETTLDLKLIGVAAGRDGALSQAIIAGGNHGEETTYAVGATLPGGAVIKEILPDRVIIAHSGRLEALRLPVVGTSILAAGMDFGGEGSNGPFGNLPGVTVQRSGAGSSPAETARRLAAHPDIMTRYLRWHPYTQNGQQKGVMINPGSNPEFFERSGLKPGDVITSVNGIKLDNARDIMRGMSSLRGTAHVVVLRNGKEVPVTVDFSKLNSGG